MTQARTFTAFEGHRRIASGELETVARALEAASDGLVRQVFDDRTGRPVDLDLRSGPEAAAADYRAREGAPEAPPARAGRGRPRLGVVPREVTLLPRHWDWLAAQPGGASAALRRLVDEARRTHAGADQQREAREAAYRVMSALAGDLPGFEAASRALFAGDLASLKEIAAAWPPDVADYVGHLATGPCHRLHED